jgi:predicted HD superfamily hydrolase involved in NAD metabolism
VEPSHNKIRLKANKDGGAAVTPWAELEALLAEQLQGERLAHTYRVRDTAVALGALFGVDLDQAARAGLMHDWARSMPGADLLAHAHRLHLITDPAEEAQPLLLHGPVAAALLQERGAITDPDVLQAIRWHTTGRAGMSTLEKVVWLADYTEPGRRFPGVDEVRAAARQDLDKALLMALDQSIRFVVDRGRLLHVATVNARNALLLQQ